MAEKTLHMETTRIKAQKTIAEIQELLAEAGATQVTSWQTFLAPSATTRQMPHTATLLWRSCWKT